MYVEVWHGLTCALTACIEQVNAHIAAFLHKVLRHLFHSSHKACQRFFIAVQNIHAVLFRDCKDMSVNVLCRIHKHKGMLVLIDLHWLKFTAYELAENTVVHFLIFMEISKHFTEWVRAPREMMSTPVSATERIFSEVPREQWDERLYRTALLSRPETMAEGEPAYLTAELAAYALGEGDPLWLQYVPYDRQTAALVEDAVQRNPAAVAFADPRLITEQLAKEAVMADPQTFCLLPIERQTESLALLAVTQDPELMGEMPERVCTNRVAWAAVYTSLEVVDRIPPALRSADLMYYAISCDPTLARQLPLFLLYDDLFMNRLKAIPNGWSDYLPEED